MGEVPEQAPLPPLVRIPIWKKRNVQIGGLAAVLLLGVGGFFALRKPPLPPPPAAAKPKPPATPAAKAAVPPAATAPATANVPAQPSPGLSETQDAIAHAPVNAINKAKDVVGKRVGGGQGRDAVGAITDADQPASPVDKPAVAAPAAPQTIAGSRAIAPGVSATNDNVSAAAEASPAFRSFVANAKISGVFQGAPPRVMINGHLARAGDLVDSALGITFDSIDPDKKLILFKDKAGAVVTRRY